jgi:hypothetical protein
MNDLFADFALPSEATAKCFIVHPITKTKLTDADGNECWIELHGWNSKAAQAYRFEREDELRRLGRDLTSEELYDGLGAMIARLTIAWQLIAPTGQKIAVPCTTENAVSLYNSLDHRWIREQVILFLNSEGNFLPAGWLH